MMLLAAMMISYIYTTHGTKIDPKKTTTTNDDVLYIVKHIENECAFYA